MTTIAARYTLVDTGLNGSTMDFPSVKKDNMLVVRARQRARTFSRNARRRRDSLVDSAKRTTKRVSKQAEKAVAMIRQSKFGRMMFTKALTAA